MFPACDIVWRTLTGCRFISICNEHVQCALYDGTPSLRTCILIRLDLENLNSKFFVFRLQVRTHHQASSEQKKSQTRHYTAITRAEIARERFVFKVVHKWQEPPITNSKQPIIWAFHTHGTRTPTLSLNVRATVGLIHAVSAFEKPTA
jgi:hypothetical protein